MSEEIRNEKTGIIIKGVGGLYEVRPDFTSVAVSCRARGVFRYEGVSPLPGDRVVIASDTDNGDYVIDKILPRKNSLIRPPAANLTHIITVIPAAAPKPDLLGADKLISIAENLGIEPVIVVNKSDIDPASADSIRDIYTAAGFTVFTVSAASGMGCGDIRTYLENESRRATVVAAAAGVSGAGKSTLLTELFPELRLRTGGLSRKTERGRHTTRHVELYPVTCDGGEYYIADTPGFSLLDFTKFNFFSLDELPYTYREFRPLLGECRYTKCTHLREEGCAVLGGVKNGSVPKSRHASYVSMYEEVKKKPEWKRRRELESK